SLCFFVFFFSSRRRHTRFSRDWSSDVCSSDLRELFAFYDALADERHVGLSLSGEGIVDGDRLMMRRALSNLLSNAMRHTPPGGEIGRASCRERVESAEGAGAVRREKKRVHEAR